MNVRSCHSKAPVGSSVLLWLGLILSSSPAAAQTPGVQVGGHISLLRVSELETTSVGVGADVIWPVTPIVAIDGTFTWVPDVGDLQKGAFKSQDRALGLAGIRATAGAGRIEFFARGRVGFLRFSEQQSVICIAIVPAPLGCRLAAGYTAFASELGGGANIGMGDSGRIRVQIEAADLLTRYVLQALRTGGKTTDGFISHNPLVSIGLGWRL